MKNSLGLAFVLCTFLLSLATPAAAINTGTDIIVPAAGRGGGWVTDLYVLNPGSATAAVSISWLVRDHANSTPAHMDYSLSPGETLSLEDVILSAFGLSSGSGAFRVTADQAVLVNSRIYSADGSETFGQGFEGVPVEMATAAGGSSDVVGLAFNDSFRTNIYGCAGGDGATVNLSLRSLNGTEIAATTKTLRAWEPFLQKANTLLGSGNFDDGTLHVSVSAGTAVLGASKVDNASTDPTTLEGSAQCSGGSGDAEGTFQISLYDSANYATGGQMRIENGAMTMLDATYTNWDKVDTQGNPACKWIFLLGSSLDGSPSLGELENGVSIVADYSSSNLGSITYTLKLSASGKGFSGTIDAVGSGFPADVDGCNGTFPQQIVYAGVLPLP